ncbi:MAG: hypothetical protein ACI8S6_005134 [Myxococcota bacterium]
MHLYLWKHLFGAGPPSLVPVVASYGEGERLTILDLRSGRRVATHSDNYDELGGYYREPLEGTPLDFLERFFDSY